MELEVGAWVRRWGGNVVRIVGGGEKNMDDTMNLPNF